MDSVDRFLRSPFDTDQRSHLGFAKTALYYLTSVLLVFVVSVPVTVNTLPWVIIVMTGIFLLQVD